MTKIDLELIASIMLEINDRVKTLVRIFPDEPNVQHLLKNLAGAGIHLALFSKDLYEHQSGDNLDIKLGHEKKFLEECGCKDINK
jgi:hypothetical protein